MLASHFQISLHKNSDLILTWNMVTPFAFRHFHIRNVLTIKYLCALRILSYNYWNIPNIKLEKSIPESCDFQVKIRRSLVFTSVSIALLNNLFLVWLLREEYPLITLRKKCLYSEFSGRYFLAFGLNTETFSVISVFSPNAGKYEPEKLQIRTLHAVTTSNKYRFCIPQSHW